MIRETRDKGDVFAFDEDMMLKELEDDQIDYYTNDIETNSDDSTDETKQRKLRPNIHKIPFKFSQNRDVQSNRLPSLSVAASLPVTISRGLCTPYENLVSDGDTEEDEDNELEKTELDEKTKTRPRAKMILSSREDEMYRNMQAYSRSIQPADDPERLFGERPHRRYRPTEQSGGGSNASDNFDGFAIPSSLRIRDGCSIAAIPDEPIIANDLNLISEGGRSDNNNGSSNKSLAKPRIIIPSSLSSGYFF